MERHSEQDGEVEMNPFQEIPASLRPQLFLHNQPQPLLKFGAYSCEITKGVLFQEGTPLAGEKTGGSQLNRGVH